MKNVRLRNLSEVPLSKLLDTTIITLALRIEDLQTLLQEQIDLAEERRKELLDLGRAKSMQENQIQNTLTEFRLTSKSLRSIIDSMPTTSEAIKLWKGTSLEELDKIDKMFVPEEKRNCSTCQHQCESGAWTGSGDYITPCTDCNNFGKWTEKEEEQTHA